MRIRELELIRYGCFTDVRVELPPAVPDLQLLMGPNEAGKSTIQAALEDLLYGIPVRSAMAFLHPYRDMRLGAVIEAPGARLAFRRRKGMKNTVLRGDDTPLPEGERALTRLLGGTSRDRFQRLFSLDHVRLRRGGREILEAKGDLGEALFSASSGFQDLRAHAQAIDREAGELWARRRSAKRRYYQAADRLEDAQRAIREQSVHVSTWRRLRDEVGHRREEYEELGRRVAAVDRELRKLARIRRVARRVSEKEAVDRELGEIGPVPPLSRDARETLQTAEGDERVALEQADRQRRDLELAREERSRLSWDEPLLRRASEVDRLQKSRLQVQRSRTDLPKREAELAAARRAMAKLASELGWTDGDTDSVVQRVPSHAAVADVRNRLNKRAGLVAGIRAADRALAEAGERTADAEFRLGETEESVDVSRLRALVSAARRESGDVLSRIRTAGRELEEALASVDTHFVRLRPALASAEAAAALAVPSAQEVQGQREREARLAQERARIEDRIDVTEKELAEARQVRDRILTSERPVGEREVADLRSRRDTGWQLVRRRYIEGEPVAEEEVRAFADRDTSLPWAYEQSVRAADAGADRRVETAGAHAQLEQANRRVRDLIGSLEALREEEASAGQRTKDAQEDWRSLWEGAPFEPLAPDVMLAWLDIHERVRQAVALGDRWQRELASCRREESEATGLVLSELQALGIDTDGLAAAGLPAVLERGSDVREHHEQRAKERSALQTEVKRTTAAEEAKRTALEEAKSELEAWTAEWSRAVAALGISAATEPEAVQAQLDVIDTMRAPADEIAHLRDRRIILIRRDIQSYEETVRDLAAAVAPDLSERDPDEAQIEMERRLEVAQETERKAEAQDLAIEALEERVRGSEERRRAARRSIAALQAEAGAPDIDTLRHAIEKAERVSDLGAERARVIEVLVDAGDGRSIGELEAECRGVDLDQAASREAELKSRIGDLREREATARDAFREAQTRFRDVGGGNAAALAEGARQSALAEMREIAEQYIRRRSTALLLEWAIERNRRERQGPMLRRAGELFAELTRNSFQALELDFDDRDRARLVGRRPSGERVGVDGMSTGSADQLFLALRVAAIEEHAAGSPALPFLADDLFVHFDDRRAAAGFQVLARLAATCQVIFLTHHEHLADVARDALTGPVGITRLPERAPASRTQNAP